MQSVPQEQLIEGPPPPPRMVVVAEAVIVAPVRPHPDATCPAGLSLIIGKRAVSQLAPAHVYQLWMRLNLLAAFR